MVGSSTVPRAVLLGAWLAAGPVLAASSRLTVAAWAGWAGVQLTEVEANYHDRYVREVGPTFDPFGILGDGVDEERMGWGAGVEFGVRVLPGLSAAGRIGLARPGSSTLRISSSDAMGFFSSGTGTKEVTSEMSATIVPALAGIAFETAGLDVVRLRLAVFAGLAIAQARERNSRYETEEQDTNGDFVYETVVVEDHQWSGRYEGRGPAGEVSAGLLIPVSRMASLAVEGAYRIARISRMKLAGPIDEDGDGIEERPAGDPYRDFKGRPMPFDLSGAEFRIAVRFEL